MPHERFVAFIAAVLVGKPSELVSKSPIESALNSATQGKTERWAHDLLLPSITVITLAACCAVSEIQNPPRPLPGAPSHGRSKPLRHGRPAFHVTARRYFSPNYAAEDVTRFYYLKILYLPALRHCLQIIISLNGI
jgi:hypothetical protein